MQKITPCLWLDDEAEEAAAFYTSVFPRSQVVSVSHYAEGAPRPAGTVMIVELELDEQRFTLLNGGPQFTFDEAISFQVSCDSQDEVDVYWERLSEGGETGVCGWLKDRFGLSWQIVPTALPRLMSSANPEAAQRVMAAVFGMTKPVIADLERAAAGDA